MFNVCNSINLLSNCLNAVVLWKMATARTKRGTRGQADRNASATVAANFVLHFSQNGDLHALLFRRCVSFVLFQFFFFFRIIVVYLSLIFIMKL